MSITVDTTDGAVVLVFKDDHEDVVGIPNGNDGNPVVVGMSSDSPNLFTLTPGADPLTQAIVPVAAGDTGNVVFTVTNTDGSDTGLAPAPLSCPILPGPATHAEASITGGTP